MASNPTKILLYDLDPALGKLMDDLKRIQGTFPTLYDRMLNIGVDLFDEDTKAVVQDLIDAYHNDHKGSARERLQQLEQLLEELTSTHETDILLLQEQIQSIRITPEQLEMGNYNQSFTYDAEGNVKTHTVTGDQAYTVTYNYKTDGSGELTNSVKTFTDNDGNLVTITTAYTYTNGDITGISTSTTVTSA